MDVILYSVEPRNEVDGITRYTFELAIEPLREKERKDKMLDDR